MNRSNKTSMFDLNDDDGELTLTHYGQSLSGLDELPDVDREDDGDEENPRGTLRMVGKDELFFWIAVWA